MKLCPKCVIVYEQKTCPLCNLREHDNQVHDFIESKGRKLVDELVKYQNQDQKENRGKIDNAPNQNTRDRIEEVTNKLATRPEKEKEQRPVEIKTNAEDIEHPEHLGDGVYALWDGYGIWLHANDHLLPTDMVYLEPEVMKALTRFRDRNLEKEKRKTETSRESEVL